MQKINFKNDIIKNKKITATIGFFDGVHCGHKFLISQLKKEASNSGSQTMIVTFINHPRLLFDPKCNLKQLSLPDERLYLLDKTGVDYTLLIDFDKEFASITSYQFMEMLHDRFSVQTLIVGYDHHFGSDRCNGIDYYISAGKKIGIDVIKEERYDDDQVSVSSSKIRRCLTNGDTITAKKYLGYYYFVKGTVVKGQQIGRTIHYPTANIEVNHLKLLPADGVYATIAEIDEKKYHSMTNIGIRPTVKGKEKSIETHIFDFDTEIYGKNIKLNFVEKIRSEKKFDNIYQLRNQIEKDEKEIRHILGQCI